MILVLIGAYLVNGLRGYQLPEEWITNALRAGRVPDPVSMDGILTSGGFCSGWRGMDHVLGRVPGRGPIVKRLLRYGIGLVGVVILWMGLGGLSS